MAKILILGGTGSVGLLIARHLIAQSETQVTIASRKLEKAQAAADDLGRNYPGRVAAVRAEAADSASLHAAFPGHALVVVASPTTAYTAQVARAALDCGTDYLDVQLGRKKLATLQALASGIEKAGRCFITEAGFHPGLPSALVRFAASHLDSIESAVTAGYLGINREIPYSDAVEELVDLFKNYNGRIFANGRWTPPETWQMRQIDFGGDIGRKQCFSLFFEELRALPALYPSLKETGFFISESHWVNDWIVAPLVILMLKTVPFAKRTIGRFLWWGMIKFRKAPYRTELVVKASGIHAGQPTNFEAAVSHSDPYELTAIPVVAALLQYLDGSARKPGLWLMGHLVEPRRLMTDMKRMGAKLRTATN
jgi:saccharopine dehydrogenase-like NADP-dependent oxidoreductase